MPRIKKPKYLFYKNALPERMPEIGEVVSVYCDDGDLYIEGTVIELEYKDEEIEGFKLVSSCNIAWWWWWHMSTFHEGGSNNDKILRVKESL